MTAYLIPDSGSSLFVEFDLTETEGHEFTSEVTDHPVEAGSDITDHIRPQPQTLSLQMFVTQTPIGDGGGRGAPTPVALDIPPAPPTGFLSALGFPNIRITPPAVAQVLAFPVAFDRIKETHDRLLELWQKSITVSVVTSIRTYLSMALTRVSLPKNEPGGATITIELKQITTVTTASVKAPQPLEKRGAPSTSKGAQSTNPVNDSDNAKSTSLARKALAALGIGGP